MTQERHGALVLSQARRARRGFTLVELMVVISIIILAAGLMTPTITDFFKNRQLENIRGQFGSALNGARLRAVTRGTPFSVVFFRDGVRVYDERGRTFDEEIFSADTSLLSGDEIWYVLGFLDDKPSTTLPRFRDWEKLDSSKFTSGESKGAASKRPAWVQYETDDLPKVSFLRDGSLRLPKGSDVDSRVFKEAIPTRADVAIYQGLNNVACFFDLRAPGQFRSKVVPLDRTPVRPSEGGGAEGGTGGAGG